MWGHDDTNMHVFRHVLYTIHIKLVIVKTSFLSTRKKYFFNNFNINSNKIIILKNNPNSIQ